MEKGLHGELLIYSRSTDTHSTRYFLRLLMIIYIKSFLQDLQKALYPLCIVLALLIYFVNKSNLADDRVSFLLLYGVSFLCGIYVFCLFRRLRTPWFKWSPFLLYIMAAGIILYNYDSKEMFPRIMLELASCLAGSILGFLLLQHRFVWIYALSLQGLMWFLLVPFLINYEYGNSMMMGYKQPEKLLRIRTWELTLLNADSMVVNSDSLFNVPNTTFSMSFKNCKPCIQKMKVLNQHATELRKKMNLFAVYNGRLDSFSDYLEVCKTFPNVPVYFDPDDRITEQVRDIFTGYPLELKLGRKATVQLYRSGFDINSANLFLSDYE